MNQSVAKTSSLFVSNRKFLSPGGGGVQWCTREYLDTLTTSNLEVQSVPFDIDRSLSARMMRRLRPRPYANLLAPNLASQIKTTAARRKAKWCFLNNNDACSLAPKLRLLAPDLRLIFLSHGVETTDVVNNLRLAPETLAPAQRSHSWLGRLIQSEIAQRQAIDGVVSISEYDDEFERWLGSTNTLFLPRQIPRDELTKIPMIGRVGCVSTLNHGPNLHGLRLLGQALESADGISLRIVGGPERVGCELATQFKSITYCGRLDDAALRQEAATWRAFVNPIFCPARGASTKVATALSWGLPVLTTPHGARGYRWDDTMLPLPDSPTSLVDLVRDVAQSADSQRWFDAAVAVRKRAPLNHDVAERMLHFMESIPPIR